MDDGKCDYTAPAELKKLGGRIPLDSNSWAVLEAFSELLDKPEGTLDELAHKLAQLELELPSSVDQPVRCEDRPQDYMAYFGSRLVTSVEPGVTSLRSLLRDFRTMCATSGEEHPHALATTDLFALLKGLRMALTLYYRQD